MSKRYTDTEKWKKQWFRKLTPIEKATWYFITEQCDNVGVWDADKGVAEFMVGGEIDWDAFIARINNNIEILDNGKWWIVDYCKFQHTDLSPDSKSKPVMSYIKLLKKHGLYDRVMKDLKVIESSSKGLKERVKEKEEVKVEEKEWGLELVEEKESSRDIFRNEVLEYYKNVTGKKRVVQIPKEVGARYDEGYTMDDAKKVIFYKHLKWWDDNKTREWVNLKTLFRPSHFGEYLSQAESELSEIEEEKYKQFRTNFVKENMYKSDEERKKVHIPTKKEWELEYARA